MFKRFMRSAASQNIAGFLLAAYMVLIKYTTRWDVVGHDRVAHLMGNGEGLIALTWHSRFMMLNSAWKKRYQMPHVLISKSRDGAIVTRTSHFLGLKAIRGSAKRAGSSKGKGGAAAFRTMQSALEAGGCVVITPDGPKGPRQRLGGGPLTLAKLSGAPVFSCIFSVKNRKVMKSWDKFILPLPFGKGQIIWGEPIYVAKDISESELAVLNQKMEAEMNRHLTLADTALGHEAILPNTSQGAK